MSKKSYKNEIIPKINYSIPPQVVSQQRQQFHKNQLINLYQSFVTYFPQAQDQKQTNRKLIQFLRKFYPLMKKRHFYLKRKQSFLGILNDICKKLKDKKYLENKKMILNGEITIQHILKYKAQAFIDYKEQKETEEKLLKESQVQIIKKQQQDGEKQIQQKIEIKYYQRKIEMNEMESPFYLSQLQEKNYRQKKEVINKQNSNLQNKVKENIKKEQSDQESD